MARSHGIVKVTIWDPASDFRRLTRDAQRTYLLLLSQPQINNCGVLPYTPERWVRMAADDNSRAQKRALRELSEHNFVVIDERTGELLVRTFVRHDRIESQPNLVKAAQREFREIESVGIRALLYEMHPWLSPGSPDPSQMTIEPLREGVREGVPEGVREPLAEGVGEPPRVRARAPRAAPAPSPQERKTSAVDLRENGTAEEVVHSTGLDRLNFTPPIGADDPEPRLT
jgi:hypothetical protein